MTTYQEMNLLSQTFEKELEKSQLDFSSYIINIKIMTNSKISFILEMRRKIHKMRLDIDHYNKMKNEIVWDPNNPNQRM